MKWPREPATDSRGTHRGDRRPRCALDARSSARGLFWVRKVRAGRGGPDQRAAIKSLKYVLKKEAMVATNARRGNNAFKLDGSERQHIETIVAH